MTDVVVIGAGMAGIACARALKAAGVPVRLFEKSRGVGGRMATRRAEVRGHTITFDHGVQYLDTSQEAAEIAALAGNAAQEWALSGHPRAVGAPAMSSLPKALAQDLDITFGTRVLDISMGEAGWDIRTDAGATTATHVVLAIPAPQIPPILGDTHAIVRHACRAVMRPCLTLMAAFDPGTPAPFTTRRDADAILTWIARDDTKPGRDQNYSTWVAQAHSDWSAMHIDQDRDGVKTQMAGLLCDALGMDPAALRHTGLQGWRYAFVETPLNRPFVVEGRLWAGGDWCLGSKVQDAWLSGSAIAEDVIASLTQAAGGTALGVSAQS